MSIGTKLIIVAAWALVIIIGELIVFWQRKRRFIKNKPTIALIIREDFSPASESEQQ